LKQTRLEVLKLALVHGKEWAETLIIAAYYEEYVETGKFNKDTKNERKKQR
tara:strand:+ start:1875 stop:2027 length:153 start_codon:yes stop_codon:yes gene_type:complete